MNIQASTRFNSLSKDPQQSPTLPGYYYSDDQIFQAEKQNIFFKSWQLVAHRSELTEPGSFVCAKIANEQIFVIRTREGELKAFYNVCQHRAHQLLQGKGKAKGSIVCPYHAWTYNMDGTLRAARNTEEMPDFDKNNFSLTPVKIDEAIGFVFVNLDLEAKPLRESAGALLDDISAKIPWLDEVVVDSKASAATWDGSFLDANWKVLAENCLECYHCQPAHPAFVDLIDIETYHRESNGNWLHSYGNLKKSENEAYDVSPSEPLQSMAFWYLWPNIEFGLLPGERALSVFRFVPASPHRTMMVSMMLTPPGEAIKQDRLDYRWNVLWPEDESICKSVHQGLQSQGYRQGRFVVDNAKGAISEHGVHGFQLSYAKAMNLPEQAKNQ